MIKIVAGLSVGFLLTNCVTVQKPITKRPMPSEPQKISPDTTAIWQKYQRTAITQLMKNENADLDPAAKPWLELALISKKFSDNIGLLSQELSSWQLKYPQHPGNVFIPQPNKLYELKSNTYPNKIALLLPLQGPYAHHARLIKEGFLKAYYHDLQFGKASSIKFYNTNNGEPIELTYNRALADGAEFVVGPLLKNEVQALSNSSIDKPTLALNYAMNEDKQNLFQFGLLPGDEIKEIVARAELKGYHHALIIAAKEDWSTEIALQFKNKWSENNLNKIEEFYFDKSTKLKSALAELFKLVNNNETGNNFLPIKNYRQDFEFIFLVSQPKEARIIVPALRFNYAAHVPIYAYSSIYSSANIQDINLIGVTVCDVPINFQPTGNERQSNAAKRLLALGHDAFKISQSIDRLKGLPYFPLYSHSGALTLDNSRIHRHLPCITLKDGQQF